jgi:hypothetical protein
VKSLGPRAVSIWAGAAALSALLAFLLLGPGGIILAVLALTAAAVPMLLLARLTLHR